MMKKRPTTTWQRAAYALLIPGIAVLLWSFSHKNEDIKATAAAATPPIAWQWSPVEDLAKSEPNGYPLPRENTVVTSEFGMRMHPITKEEAFHRGQDFKAKVGTPIYATGEGIVIKVELINEGTGYGHHVILQHGEHFQTLYSCMDKIMVEEGQTVRRGLQIGTVGNTGMSTAPHLHYEIHKDGTAVNPKEYLGKRNNTDEC